MKRLSEFVEPRSLSVVIAVFNGASSIPELCRRLTEVLVARAAPFEIIFVNDCSRDHSWEVIETLATHGSSVRGINFMRNYGQHNALLCGIRAARYGAIVTMDDDLQHAPEEIPGLLERLNEGFDVVYGTPESEQNGFLRAIASYVTRLALRAAVGADVAKNVSAFRVFRTQLRDAFKNYQAPFVSIDVLLTWGTTRFAAKKCTFSAPLLWDVQLHFQEVGAACTGYDDRLQHRAFAIGQSDWFCLHTVWSRSLCLCRWPLFSPGEYSGVSVSGFDHRDLFRC